ncbi:MAG: hypothetical protein H6850_01590 [Alphaproteobacteria bacterium]|nr:MAG: hypothetical protein H6850_01590 [Alphaproteobacteria bacterium]
MSIDLSITVSAIDDFCVSAIAIELHKLVGGVTQYQGTFWHAAATTEGDTTVTKTSPVPQVTLDCPTTAPENYFGNINGMSAPISIPLSNLTDADNFIVIKACVFTKAIGKVIDDLNGSTGKATAGTLLANEIASHTSAGSAAPTTAEIAMVDSWSDGTNNAAGSICWYFPVNPAATLTTASSAVTLSVTGTLI